MLCYRNVLAGALADGGWQGMTGQISVNLYRADWYKLLYIDIEPISTNAFYLTIGGFGSITERGR